MKRYAKYKVSGISWIGEIPEHWNVCRLKYVVSCNDETLSETKDPNSKIEYVEIGDVNDIDGITNSTFYSFKEAPSRARRITKKNDIIISTVRTYLKAIARIESDDLIVSTGFAVLRAKESVLPDYLGFLTKCNGFTGDVLKHSIGVSYPAISCTKLLNISIVKPPLEDQMAIAEFLDNKTKQINELVSAKQKQIELLKEYKQAVIAKAVTQGINPKTKMKDSGISWIGQIPEHWDVNYLFQKAKEHFISNKNIHHQNLLSLSYGRIVQKNINSTEGLLPESFDTYQIVENGNVVLRLTDLQNDHRSLRVGLVTQEGIITSAYVALEVLNETLNSEYFYFQLHTFDIKKMFYGMGGGLRQNLNYNELKKIKIAVPPPEEQSQIVAYIKEKVSAIDSQISSIEKQIANLNEYKQSLISDVVTGKVKVA